MASLCWAGPTWAQGLGSRSRVPAHCPAAVLCAGAAGRRPGVSHQAQGAAQEELHSHERAAHGAGARQGGGEAGGGARGDHRQEPRGLSAQSVDRGPFARWKPRAGPSAATPFAFETFYYYLECGQLGAKKGHRPCSQARPQCCALGPGLETRVRRGGRRLGPELRAHSRPAPLPHPHPPQPALCVLTPPAHTCYRLLGTPPPGAGHYGPTGRPDSPAALP